MVSNYHSISLLSISGKCLESCIHAAGYNHFVPILSDWQHGFRGDPALPNLPHIYHQLAKAWDEGPQIDVVFLDLAKLVCRLSLQLSAVGVHSWLHPGPSIFC